MSQPPVQVRTYASQAEYEADIAAAGASGWVPVSQAWDGYSLHVTFGPGPKPRQKTTPAQWIAGGVLVVLGLLVLGAVFGGDRDRTTGSGPARSTPTVRSTPVVYAVLGDREWAQLVKSPDAHEGEALQVWACITQFDAATGSEGFRGQALNKESDTWFIAGENAVFTGDSALLAEFVKDDVVSMNVLSSGSLEYDTQIGGRTVAPAFEVVTIRQRGSC